MFLLLPISHCRCNCVITTLFLGSNFRNIFEGFHLYCKFIPSNVLQGHLTGKKCVWTQSIKPLLMSGFCRMKWLGVWMLAFWGRFKEAFTYLHLPFSITSSLQSLNITNKTPVKLLRFRSANMIGSLLLSATGFRGQALNGWIEVFGSSG